MGFIDTVLGGNLGGTVQRQVGRAASELGPNKTVKKSAKTIDDPLPQLLVKPGRDAGRFQKEALGKQRLAQRQAESQARSQQRTSSEQRRKANAKSPNVAALLSSAIAAGTGGVSSTLLSNLSGGLGGSRTTLGGRG